MEEYLDSVHWCEKTHIPRAEVPSYIKSRKRAQQLPSSLSFLTKHTM